MNSPIRTLSRRPATIPVATVLAALFLLAGCGDRLPPSYPTPTPTPAGVEFARAEAFWNNTVAPAVVDAGKAIPALTKCGSKLTTPCHDAIVVVEQKLAFAIMLITNGDTNGDIPACIATDVRRFKGDLEVLDAGLQIALLGYKAGDPGQVDQGLTQFREGLVPVNPDANAVTHDVQTLCN